MSEVTRAISFINYHIPYREHNESHFKYTTMGFFDGMDTKALSVEYARDGLKVLWQYILDRTAQSNGLYSYQNVFCFSDDTWNDCRDEYFWDAKTDNEYPLAFVSLLQLRDYSITAESIQKRCREYSNAISKELGDCGRGYVYCTIDKNDFVVCIKCKYYQKAVEIIQKMHRMQETIYSYTVFSVLTDILEVLDSSNQRELFQQILPSICLKGVANSYDPFKNAALDKRYYNFSMQLVSRVYGISQEKLREKQGKVIEDTDAEADGKRREIQVDYKIYDILGDDDFRLIVRNVNLGRLMKQFAEGGLLSYKSNFFRFYLFSSSLILNTYSSEYPTIDNSYKNETMKRMEAEFQPPKCQLLEKNMNKLKEVILYREKYKNEKIITCCHAIWQLIQSMKALEAAPTKKYDFLSLYYPLKSLVNILDEKMSSTDRKDRELLEENEEIFEFIHKISMTIHGTLRTDIQFFQIRDFNAIVHYAPAKLRAFYTFWTMRLKDYYNKFIDSKARTNEYAFIFSPGMFSGTSVRQLFVKYDETHRLMLITVPERHLYAPKWLSIILAHETSHFVGWKIRNREFRQEVWVECCIRAFVLEMRNYVYRNCPEEYRKVILNYYHNNCKFEKNFSEQLKQTVAQIVKGEPLWPHQYHSKNSFHTIIQAFYGISNEKLEKLCAEEWEFILKRIEGSINWKEMGFEEKVYKRGKISKFVEDMNKFMMRFYGLYNWNMLEDLLKYFQYISSEVYADLNAILTLNLTPWDYIRSFFSCELDKEYLKKYNQDYRMLLPYRIALCIKALTDVVREIRNADWLRRNEQEFYEAWSYEVLEELPKKFLPESEEARLAIKCRALAGRLSDYSDNICAYQGAYLVEKQAFSMKETKLFLDQDIWNSILSYIKRCAEDYLSELIDNSNLQKMKKSLISAYQAIAGDSVNRMVQEMENFLSDECEDISELQTS